jgi:acyl-CoA thioesterase
VQESPAALNSRGHTRGLFYNQQGDLLACVNQESFLTTLPKAP